MCLISRGENKGNIIKLVITPDNRFKIMKLVYIKKKNTVKSFLAVYKGKNNLEMRQQQKNMKK